jgi:hypothetical protein
MVQLTLARSTRQFFFFLCEKKTKATEEKEEFGRLGVTNFEICKQNAVTWAYRYP